MKKRLVWLVVAAALVIGGVYFYTTKKGEKQDENVIKIGAILPLTGNLSYLGEEEKNVLMILMDSINKNSEKKIDILFEDSKGNPKDGVSAYQKLKQQGVSSFFTSLTVIARSIAPLVDKNNDIQFVTSIDPKITKEYKNTFQIYYNIADEIDLAVMYFSSIGVKSVSALYIQTPEDEIAINQYLKPFLKRENIEFVNPQTYSFTDKSLKNQLLKIKESQADIIYTIDFGYMYPTMLNEAKEYGIREKIFGGLGMMTAPQMAIETTNGIRFIASSFVINPSSNYSQFKDKYYQKYAKNITFDGVYSYDAVNLLFKYLSNPDVSFIGKWHDGISGKIFVKEDKSSKVDISLAQFDEKGNIIPKEFK